MSASGGVPLALHVSGELGYEAGMANVYCVGMLDLSHAGRARA